MKGYKTDEKHEESFSENGKLEYIITSKNHRDIFFLYRVENGEYIKTEHKSKNPMELKKYAGRWGSLNDQEG